MSDEPRHSNRLSGFFNNLISRKEPPASPLPVNEEPTLRPTTPPPPPPLPPPSLHDLGLSLDFLTHILSPSHFTAPPTSGAFLKPHYLLLCHPQGLDVLPLISPPTPQPYALVRRVHFKSVVVMEQRGVLVAIAGRRDGVRVYALEEIKKAIEWRIDLEVRRERDRSRRESVKKILLADTDSRNSSEKHKSTLSTDHHHLLRKSSLPSPPPPPLIPRSPTPRTPRRSKPPQLTTPTPHDHPPPYSSPTEPPSINHNKDDWSLSSDDEAIDIVAAAASGSQALDERTSANPRRSSTTRNRPANLDLSLSRSDNTVVAPEPSPAPTLLTLRQALSNSPSTRRTIHTQEPVTPFPEDDDQDEDDGVSLAQILFESRLPDLPPAGSTRPQQPILLSSATVAEPETETSSLRTDAHSISSRPTTADSSVRRRRRWSTLLGASPLDLSIPPPPTAPLPRGRPHTFTRSQSFRSNNSTVRPSTSPSPDMREATPSIASARSSRFIPRILSSAFSSRRSEDRPAMPPLSAIDLDVVKRPPSTPVAPHAPPPKLEYVKLPGTKGALMLKTVETPKKSFLAILCGENGEKVELFAGTYRTALGLSRTFILPDSPRSLELQLQGDDLVEVFLVFSQNVFGLEPATVRVREVRIGRAERRAARRRARGVRGGAGEGAANNDSETALVEEDTNVTVSIDVSVPVTSADAATGESAVDTLIPNEHPDAQLDSASPQPDADAAVSSSSQSAGSQADDVFAIAAAQMGPYTTFQQLSFAPRFPLASIADEYIIPPTYPSFLEYKAEHEQQNPGDLAQIQFTPPGLPVPVPTAPSRWYYRDPKNVVHGPWKASLMQAWFKDGMLPLDLPVRREEEENYILLKDLRLQSVDPTHPFVPLAPPAAPAPAPAPTTTITTAAPLPAATTTESIPASAERPLLPPISLLAQPRHFGPPALFFSSRGGHSTTIVDARGRSVLKGRFVWSSDEAQLDDETKAVLVSSGGRMGDIKRLEALDVHDNRAVLVAMRQGGLEAVDLSDALLRPADASRTVLPEFAPPVSNINRRAPFVWKIGTPVSASASSSSSSTTTTSASALPLKGKSNAGLGHLPASRKASTGPARSPAIRSEFSVGGGDLDPDSHDEVLFLGRKDDEIYFCERNAGSFRILRLCPSLA
ncbi:hypothetical protein H0H92_001523 [Tricholoma furcatifolium]|nr:hypothetical protein H0H92_001523 [Tricholoma furcatifolium]